MPNQVGYDKSGIASYIDETGAHLFDRAAGVAAAGWETKARILASHRSGAVINHSTGAIVGN